MQETRSSLLRRVRDPADAASWSEFVALYEPLLLSYARKHGLAGAVVRDCAQEAFVRRLKTLPGFELDRSIGRCRTWLGQVTRNALTDWQRGRRRDEKAAAALAELAARPEPEADWVAE